MDERDPMRDIEKMLDKHLIPEAKTPEHISKKAVAAALSRKEVVTALPQATGHDWKDEDWLVL